MNQEPPWTPELFDLLLGWLDPDRERAADRYLKIQIRLIKIFTCRGCGDPEGLADITIGRVMSRVKRNIADI